MDARNNITKSLIISTTALALSGCLGSSSIGTVSLSSGSFDAAGTSSAKSSLYAATMAVADPVPVNDFKICISSVRLDRADGTAEQKVEGEDDIAFHPGLVDLSDGLAKDWGQLEVPVGFQLKKLKIKVKKDVQYCDTDYSVKFNDAFTNEDIEFQWEFEPAVDLKDGAQVVLALDGVVAKLREASEANQLSNSTIKQYIHETTNSATAQ